MATNAEQIQLDLAKCNITLWEPELMSSVQLSACKLQCIENEVDPLIATITAAIDALADIEDVATGDTGMNDVVFMPSTPPSVATWSMTAHTNGTIYFGVNTNSSFYVNYIIPGVSESTVPVQEDLGEGLVDRSASDILRDRQAALLSQGEVLEATINALTTYKAMVTAKKDSLAATYTP